uniref:SUEL-type lectin domain-containing protein n=1 Tax=Octopus bimaculoides TaxID=37653 RepID=A0A0L8G6K9_OCTBM
MLALSAVILFISSTFLASVEASPIPGPECKEPNILLHNSVAFGTASGEAAAGNDGDGDDDEDYNDGHLSVEDRAICPWKIVKVIDDSRYPRILKTVHCRTNTWDNGTCVPVIHNFTVLYRTDKCMKLSETNETEVLYAYRPDTLQLAVACTSVLNTSTVDQGNSSVHNKLISSP